MEKKIILWKFLFFNKVISTTLWYLNSLIGNFFLQFSNVKNICFQLATIYSDFAKNCPNSSNDPKRHRTLCCTSFVKLKYMLSWFCYGHIEQASYTMNSKLLVTPGIVVWHGGWHVCVASRGRKPPNFGKPETVSIFGFGNRFLTVSN